LPSVLLGRARASVLRVVLDGENQAIHMREIARRTGLAVATVQRELKILSGVGLIERARQLQQVVYRPVVSAAAVGPLRALLSLDPDPIRDLSERLKSLAAVVRCAFVIEADPSATQLVVVGDVRFEDVFAIVEPIEARHGTAIRLFVFTDDGFTAQRNRFDFRAARILVGDLGQNP
jgi:DNA-binding transcriptional ArsR family regulator